MKTTAPASDATRFVIAPAAHATWYDWSIHRSWALYARAVRGLARARPSPEFDANGYVIGTLPSAQVEACVQMVHRSPQIVMQGDDSAPGFRRSEKVYKVAKTLNAGHHYYRPARENSGPLTNLLETLAPSVSGALGSEWRVINTRILETLPSAQPMGPNAWHGDGFPPDILKVMIYLSPAGRDCGTTELQLANGATRIVEGPPGTWLLFRNSGIIHRGLPPATGSRLAIELTLMPALRRNVAPMFAGLNATYPEYPWSLNPLARAAGNLLLRPLAPPVSRGGAKGAGAVTGSKDGARPAGEASSVEAPAQDKAARAAAKQARGVEKQAQAAEKEARAAAELQRRRRQQKLTALLNRVMPPIALNVGGGSEFSHYRWLNLDGAPGPANPSPFRFDAACRFPLRDGAVQTVYSSHCLEHLDDETVARVLSEARRVLAAGGRLVVKIPDFDRALACWRSGDDSFFDADRWGLRRLVSLWPRRGVEDTLDARASMVFCGFWNDEYGDHFSDRREDERAYHGPVVMPAGDLRALATAASPHEIAATLRARVVRDQPTYHFNHQNAWSRDELRGVLERAGFEVQSFDEEAVIAAALDIPGITNARPESMYCLARLRS